MSIIKTVTREQRRLAEITARAKEIAVPGGDWFDIDFGSVLTVPEMGEYRIAFFTKGDIPPRGKGRVYWRLLRNTVTFREWDSISGSTLVALDLLLAPEEHVLTFQVFHEATFLRLYEVWATLESVVVESSALLYSVEYNQEETHAKGDDTQGEEARGQGQAG